MRYLLIAWLVVGMAPGLGEIAEAVVHYASAGHLAHSAADHGDLGDGGTEHGCGTTQHRCGCCASQVVTAAPGSVDVSPVLATTRWSPRAGTLASLHEPAPPCRPPIFSA